ncbi:unnamed protein product, partial [Choristocarpus tenellus]
MYHERQRLMHCAIHMLNNLFQESWADEKLMNGIAQEMFNVEAGIRRESAMRSLWFNPFKSVVPGLGYYDINVVIQALKLRACHISAHIVYNPKNPGDFAQQLQDFNLTSAVGIIVNRVGRVLLGGLWSTNHFYAIVSCPGYCPGDVMWYSLDSKEHAPELIGGTLELIDLLVNEGREKHGQLFVV